jgi:hypothetical protein
MVKKSNPYIVIALLSVGDTDLQGNTHTLDSLNKLAFKSANYLWVNGNDLLAFKPLLTDPREYD